MTRGTAARASAGALTILALAGVSASSADSATLTHAQFVSKANSICAAANKQVVALPARYAHASTPAQLSEYLGALLKIEAPRDSQLKQLHPSSADAATWQTFLSKTAAQTRDIVQAVADIKKGDQAGGEAALNKSDRDDPDPSAKKLGLTQCAASPVPAGK